MMLQMQLDPCCNCIYCKFKWRYRYFVSCSSLDSFFRGNRNCFWFKHAWKNVIKTVGEKITALKPSLGFSAELATATTVVVASYVGFPISTTHTLVGGVIGVGLARGAEHLNTKSITRIITSWLITIPIGAFLTILYWVFLRVIFGV